MQPCCGVYLTRIRLEGRWWPSATGISRRPTVDAPGAPVSCETYVPGFSGNVYGQNPMLEFYKYLCPIRKFDSLQALSDLITTAAAQSGRILQAGKRANEKIRWTARRGALKKRGGKG